MICLDFSLFNIDKTITERTRFNGEWFHRGSKCSQSPDHQTHNCEWLPRSGQGPRSRQDILGRRSGTGDFGSCPKVNPMYPVFEVGGSLRRVRSSGDVRYYGLCIKSAGNCSLDEVIRSKAQNEIFSGKKSYFWVGGNFEKIHCWKPGCDKTDV